MPEPEPNGSTSIKTKWFEVSGKKTAELITIFLLCLVGVLAYGFWEHKTEAKETGVELTIAIREMTSAHLGQVREQRVMNCLLATRQEDRRTMLSECERIAR